MYARAVERTNMKTILLMEDEPVVQHMLKSILEGAGYAVILASQGPEALKLVKEHDIDLFITDMCLPKRHGIATAWEMRTEGYEFPIIILSAFIDAWDKEVFKDCQIDRWITKPTKPEVLLRIIAELLNE